MGEEEWRVHRAGAPSIDHLRRTKLLNRKQTESSLQLNLDQPTALVSYHPVTIAQDTLQEADSLFAALEKLPDQLIFCYPNADAGSRSLIKRTKSFLETRRAGQLFTNLDPRMYWSLLRQVAMLIGNSSSGIMESASYSLPTVNVGIRQQGREQPMNVINAAPSVESIVAAIRIARSPQFRQSLEGMVNPYGDGHASERIVRVLINAPSSKELLLKRQSQCVPSAELVRNAIQR
jgi:UDP-N-acetylglucosamine 2-epimerase (non-hydrolysing)/GDP/UDP-N,N'-diacetylbacillosamine 2-epimerase (hydrolysing)